MSISSNLYATKVFAEHPISLYSLDEDASYVSLISDEQRLFEPSVGYDGWTVSGGTANDSLALPGLPSPFVGGVYGGIQGSIPSSNNTNIEWESPELFNLNELNQDLATFALSMYVYQSSFFVNWYEVGYRSGGDEFKTRVEAPDRPAWINFDFSYLPEQYNNQSVKIFIRANVDRNKGEIVGQLQDYVFLVNGLCVGQWSEITSSRSLGVQPITTEFDFLGVLAEEYAIEGDPGYYVVENNRLLAKNEGVPLVFGSENTTKIYPSETEGSPSFVFPGNGFLFESNRYGNYTSEFWMRIKPNTDEFKRIFGPLDNDYGIYVNNGFIAILVGDNFASHPISEWYRTMLINVSLTSNSANLLINGEQVISIPLDRNTIPLPNEQDWLGIYSYQEMTIFEIDCISLYPYNVAEEVAKRRFVYGQGTPSPQAISSSFDGTTSYIDFANANYTANRVYPDNQNWRAGYSNNLLTTRSSIAVPDYELPEIVITGRELQELYDQNKATNIEDDETFFTFRPFAPSTENLVPNGYFDEEDLLWEGINTESVGRYFDKETNTHTLRIASFSTWEKILTDGTQVFDWDSWDDGSWEGVLFHDSSDKIIGAKLLPRIEVTSNLQYQVSLDVKRILGTADDPYVAIEWYDAETGGNKIGESVTSFNENVLQNIWTNLVISGTSPPTATHAEIKFYFSRLNVDAGELQLIDNVQFYPLELNWTEPGYMFYESLNFVNRLTSLYGTFSLRDTYSYSPLMIFRNIDTEDEFKIIVEENTIKYIFNNEELYTESLDVNDFSSTNYYGYQDFIPLPQDYLPISVGINIKEFIKNYGYDLTKFFQSPELLQLYIAGDTEKTFYDRVLKIGFCNDVNHLEIENRFLENGVADVFEHQTFNNHYATYTLTPINRFNRFFMDISVASTWEEYIPLTTLAGYAKNILGQNYYDLDMIQLNIGYPSVKEVVVDIDREIQWTYSELFDEWNVPTVRSYNLLQIPEISGYNIYADLNFKRISETLFNTEKSSLRAFLTFQALTDGANQPLANFPYTQRPLVTNVIDAEAVNSRFQPFRSYLTKFEFVDKSVVLPPKTVDFNKIAMVIHFVIKHEGIISNPLKVRDLEIASRALSQYDFNPIGTEFGVPLYPFTKLGIYFDNKEKNPLLISKKRFPYLYLTEDSGVSLLGNYQIEREHSVAVPINDARTSGFDIGALQFWAKYDLFDFPTTPSPIFQIEALDQTIEFVVRTDASGKRGTIVARNKANQVLVDGITFYQNGNRVKAPIFELNQWNSFGFAFDNPISFDQYSGYLTFFRGFTFNNISYYKPSGLGESLATINRVWGRVLSDDDINNFNWSAWYIGQGETVTETRNNLAYNPSAEISDKGWTRTGGGITVDRITTDSRFGNAAIRCISSSANNAGLVFGGSSGLRIPAAPLTEYTASIYVKVPEGFDDKDLRIRIRQYTQVTGGSTLATINSDQIARITSEDGWLRLFLTYLTGPSTNAMGIEVSQPLGNVSGQQFYVDGLLIEESANLVPKVGPYFDGSTDVGGLLSQSRVWNGDPHDSTSTVIYFVPAEDQIKQWIDLFVVDQVQTFLLSPSDIYESFVGTNRIVVGDDDPLIIDADSIVKVFDAKWNRLSLKPV